MSGQQSMKRSPGSNMALHTVPLGALPIATYELMQPGLPPPGLPQPLEILK